MSPTARNLLHRAAQQTPMPRAGAGEAMRRGVHLRWWRRVFIAVPVAVTASAVAYGIGHLPGREADRRIPPPVQQDEKNKHIATPTPRAGRDDARTQPNVAPDRGLPPLQTPSAKRSATVASFGLSGKLSFTATTPSSVSVSPPAEIDLMDLSTGRVSRVTSSPLNEALPAFSRDGSFIAYTGHFQTGRGELHTVRPNGAGDRLVYAPPDGAALSPTWSPDGKQIAFLYEPTTDNGPAEVRQRDSSIWIVDADGSNAHRISAITSDMEPGDPAWSPDGSRIAFTDGATGSVRVLDLATGEISEVTSGAQPEWSPDGRRLAVAQGATIAIVDPDAGTLGDTIYSSGRVEDPTWSPDGKWIAFASADDAGKRGIYVARPDRTGLKTLVQNARDNWSPSWGPG